MRRLVAHPCPRHGAPCARALHRLGKPEMTRRSESVGRCLHAARVNALLAQLVDPRGLLPDDPAGTSRARLLCERGEASGSKEGFA